MQSSRSSLSSTLKIKKPHASLFVVGRSWFFYRDINITLVFFFHSALYMRVVLLRGVKEVWFISFETGLE